MAASREGVFSRMSEVMQQTAVYMWEGVPPLNPYTLHPTPFTLHATSYTLHLAPFVVFRGVW